MRLMYLPTLFDLQGMLGDRTYIDFVWLWRDREQENLSRERLEKWRAKIPDREKLPELAVARARAPAKEIAAASVPSLVASLPVKPRTALAADAPVVSPPAPVQPIAAPFPAVLDYPPRPRSRRRSGGPF